MQLGVGCGIATTVIVLLTSTIDGHEPQTESLPVRLYDLTGQRDDDGQATIDAATAALATGGIRPEWIVCGRSTTVAACAVPAGATERLVRVMSTSPQWERRDGVSLGVALIERGSHSGVFATVYADRVSWLASRAAIHPSLVLGRAIAHEIGHLLLGREHASAGIMRGAWSVTDLRRNASCDWEFTTDEVAALSAALHSSGSSSVAELGEGRIFDVLTRINSAR